MLRVNAIRAHHQACELGSPRYFPSQCFDLPILGERIAGRPGIQGAWPRNDRTLSTGEREEIQRRLMQKGFYQGEIDGLFGSATMESVSAYQRSIGVTPDGYPTSILLDQLLAPR